jgi:CSLREA domain-containing protein
MRLLTRLCCALFVVLLSLLSPLIPPSASASDFTVNSFGDTPDANLSDGLCADAKGECTLRAAMQQWKANASGGVIQLNVTGTINLTAPLPDISGSLTINGHGPGLLTVRRDSGGAYRIFTVVSGVSATLSGFTVSNGLAPLPANGGAPVGGGGIYNSGHLTLAGVHVLGNRTQDSAPSVTPVIPGGGGGIYNDAVLMMNHCVVSDNATGSGLSGEGLDGGSGGGIYNMGSLVMADCTVSLNRTGAGGDGAGGDGAAGNGGAGGGIYNAADAERQPQALLNNVIVAGNATGKGGAVLPSPQADAGRSGSGGDGGGVYNASTARILAGTISGNLTGDGAGVRAGIGVEAGKGGSGGGIYNDIRLIGGEMEMTNCVVVRNKTGAGGAGGGVVQSNGDGGDGGGVANPSADSVLKMSQCTVVFNETGFAGDAGGRDGVGGGVYGVPRSRSSVFALNVVRLPPNLSDVAGGPFLSSGYNYAGYFGVPCCYTFGDHGGSGDGTKFFVKFDANLIPLPFSALIDAGLARDVDDRPVTTDRRGAARPFNFSGGVSPEGGDESDIGAFERQSLDPLPTPTPTPPTVQFAAPTAHVAEGCAQADITITRSGPKDGTTVASYSVLDCCGTTAHERGDFTRTTGQVTFAPGEDTKTIPVLLSEDAYAEGPETFIAAVGAVEGGITGLPSVINLTIDDNDDADGATNPIDDNATFVCQNYHDFLGRHADPDGQSFWTARLDECGGDPACLDRKRVDVSAAFFLSIESQNTGYLVYRLMRAAFGGKPINGIPYTTFLAFTQRVAGGVIVGQPGYAELIEANKRRLAEELVHTPFFMTLHANQNAAPYVDSLFANAGVTPTAQERAAAISAFGTGGAESQAASLRSVVESGSVYNKLYNPAFVLMQYFAYLRRNPYDAPDTNLDGYNFWLGKLDSVTLPGEDVRDERVALARIRRAEMIGAFLRSSEYRGRFGGDPSRGNP